MMTLLLAFVGVAKAEIVEIGVGGTSTNSYLPNYEFYNYSLTQQIYTADEIGTAGTINSIAFYYVGAASRTLDIYMVNTTVGSFSGNSDWITVTAADKVYSGSVTYTANAWNTFVLDNPFEYDGTSNLAVIVDDNTGSYVSSVGAYVFDASGKALRIYSDGTNYDPMAPPTGSGAVLNVKNQIQLDITPGAIAGAALHVKYMDGDVEVIDSLNLGVRPAGAWMEPFNFIMYAEGANYTVNLLDFTPSDGLFSVTGEELPFQVIRDEDVNLMMSTNGEEAGLIVRQFVAITEGERAAHIWPLAVELYAPEIPDVWEMACEEATTFPFVEVPATAHNIALHNDYTLPFPEIPEGLDAVYKLVFEEDQMLNASVTYGENGKVALYREGFEGEGGPMATNNYTGIGMGGGSAAAAPFEVQIGEGTSTFGYFPFYTLYNYSIAENLYLAPELEEAGVTTAPMTSLSWYATNTTGYNQQGITIWMANVEDVTLTTTSHVVTGMTKVYTGSITPLVGWNEFVFNEGTFAWDGHSNILIYCQRNNGTWNSTVYWQATTSMPFNASAYKYQDSAAYDPTVAQSMTTSTTRPNIIMKADGRSRETFAYDFETDLQGWTNIDNDGDTYGWIVATDLYSGTEGYGANGSDNFAMGFSYVNTSSGGYSFDCDDYLVSPQAYAIGNNASLSFYHDQMNASYPDYMEVCVSTAAPVVSNFTPIWNNGGQRRGNGGHSRDGGAPFNRLGTWAQQTLDLSAYAGQNVWIAFHHLAYDQYAVLVDDVTVNTGSTNPNPPTPPTPPTPSTAMSYGPVIENAAVEPGTYYLVASSTTPDFEVTINAEAMPCPPVEDFAFSPVPADDANGIEPAGVTLSWCIPDYATSWRLIFGSTYHPEQNHPQTIITDWSDNMVNSYRIPTTLWNNTNYFWRVEFRNDGCPDGVSSPVWGFTTHLNVPQNLRAADETVFNDEQIVLSWNAVVDRTYRMYNVYRDGELIGHTNMNQIGNTTYTDDPLPYNMGGYTYYVTAVYDEGESAPSNTVNVKVSGYGDVNGHVYEQDGQTGINGATVTMNGLDEFGVNHTYNFQTNNQGYYSGHIYAGTYNGQAAKDGYQTIDEPVQGNPIDLVYNQTTSPIDYILDENFDPVCTVIAQYYPDSLDPQAPYVKVYWGCGLPGEEIIEPFETGDFSKFDWQIDPTYPWSITTTNPYEGTYCMKSGGAGVANVVSNMTVTVNIPADGIMSFFGKISCESSWDYGYFFIDGVQKGSYTGNGNWGEKKFDITAGDHTFQWRYTKDGSVNSYDDCFYVDFITFYKRPEPAGPGWHTYLESEFDNAYRSNVGDPSWGYEYPTSVLSQYAGYNLTKVAVFSDDMYGAVGGNFTCNVYVGGSTPATGTLASTITVDVPVGQGAWCEYDLPTAVNVTGSDPIWVLWHVNTYGGMGYPAGCASHSSTYGDWWNNGQDGWQHMDGATWTMKNYFTNRNGRTVVMADAETAPVAVNSPVNISSNLRTFAKGQEDNTAESINPNAVKGASIAMENTRSLSHYRVYRTNCYNDGPYTEENTLLLATVWVPDTIYIDVDWPDAAPGVYKWGVGSVYEGNRGEEIAGPISWSEPIAINNDRATLTYDFDDNTMQNWTNIDADGDGNVWVSSSNPGIYHNSGVNLSGTGHNASEAYVISGSYANQTGAVLYPDNYLVSPQIALGGSISFYACAQDNNYAAEHFGVAVSTTSNTSASAFTMLQEWTMTAKGAGMMSVGRDGNNRAQGNWYQFTVDLSSYSGMGYVAIRHFNCHDEFILNVDDITIVEGAGGPTPPTPPTPGTNGLQLPRESEIVWSTNCLDKDMYLGENAVDINVLLNSADSPEGITVSFLNLNEAEQELYPVDDVVLDETGFYAWESFRKGDYQLTITMDGYETIVDNVSIWEPTSLRYVMIEIIYGVDNLYVSRTGWAMWDAQGLPPVGPTPPGPGAGDTFECGFENGLEGWSTIDNDGDGLTWVNSVNSTSASGYDYTGLAHGGNYFVYSQSYIDYVGAYNADNYLITPQKYAITSSSTLTFWADNANDSYPDHFAIALSTADTPSASSFTDVWSHQGAKGEGRAATRHDGARYQNWRSHSVDLSAYAGQSVWIAFHHQDYDEYEIWIDDVALTTGAKDGERHLEGFKVLCTSIDGEPIFTTNTVNPFCQVATDELVEGEHYICKVAAIYSTGMSDWVEAEWEYESCEHYAGTVNGLDVNGTTVTWDYPGGGPTPPPGPGSSFTVDFEGGLPTGWTVIDANNDGYTWCLTSAIPTTWTYYASLTLDWYHGGTNAICSGSYINGVGALNPDEYLVSPEVTLTSGSQLSFWVAATDASYAADHFGVFVSDNGTSDWTSVQEWTLTGKKEGMAGGAASRDGRGLRIGTWYNYTVDLGAYAGQKYVAFRHFNCYDQYIMCLDDIELTSGAKNRDDVVFFNGFVTDPGAMANGADASWIKGSQSTWGPNVNNGGGYMLADQFTLSAATTISEIEVYGYQTGSGTTSTFTGLYAQIYNGAPNAGGTAVWGNIADNIMTGTSFTNCYRGSDGETTATTRPIMAVTASGLNIDLEAGTYWLVYSLTGSGSSGPWGAPHCEPGIGNTGNGMQYTSSGWGNLMDSGSSTPYGCSMKLTGNGGSGPVPPTPSGDVLGAMVFLNGEWEAFVAAPTNTYTFDELGQYCVRIVYNGTAELPSNNFYYAMSCEECEGEPGPGTCAAGAPIHAEELHETDQVKVWWGDAPLPPVPPMEDWIYYDDGTYATSIGAGQVIYWGSMFPAASIAPYAGTNLTKVALYENSYNTSTVTVNIYLGGTTAPGTLVSTMNYTPVGGDAFHEVNLTTPVAIDGTQNLWIVFVEDGQYPANACADTGDPNNRWVSLDGADWMDVASAGVPGYGWMIRGFVTNQGKGGMVENIALEPMKPATVETSGMTLSHTEVVSRPADLSFMNRSEIVSYNVKRSDDNVNYTLVGNVPAVAGQTYYEYIDTPDAAGTYYYQVTAVYDDGCESEPALAADDPTHNYVSANVDAIGENSDKVALYPNPTSGNVTIEANGMSRITVVSVLGQVVYDTEVNVDSYTLNMAQFNAGMYMVRVYTESGVTVKRVTVMQ